MVRTCSVRPDARNATLQLGRVSGEHAVHLCRDQLGCGMQAAPARIVAQSVPQTRHLLSGAAARQCMAASLTSPTDE
jgi:hypothetical protein